MGKSGRSPESLVGRECTRMLAGTKRGFSVREKGGRKHHKLRHLRPQSRSGKLTNFASRARTDSHQRRLAQSRGCRTGLSARPGFREIVHCHRNPHRNPVIRKLVHCHRNPCHRNPRRGDPGERRTAKRDRPERGRRTVDVQNVRSCHDQADNSSKRGGGANFTNFVTFAPQSRSGKLHQLCPASRHRFPSAEAGTVEGL